MAKRPGERGGGRVRAELRPDFAIEVYQEKIPDNGEDGYYFALGDDESVVAAFDGSGGSGARRYESWQGKTGAYLAARVLAGAVRDWFANGDATLRVDAAAECLRRRSAQYLGMAKDACGGASRIRGSLSKEFPSTCAVMVLRPREGGGHEVLNLFAGDSRCYLLDGKGLHQLSQDDLHELDAFENLSADGAMTNVANASGSFDIHGHAVPVTGPCVLFAATDGCFGYLPTPMEFEYLLLGTLEAAANPEDWERKMHAAFAAVAGDDFTLCGLSVGYGSFEALKKSLAPRREELYEKYIRGIDGLDRDGKRLLWYHYQSEYDAFKPVW